MFEISVTPPHQFAHLHLLFHDLCVICLMSQGPPNLARTAKSMRAICEMTRKYHSNIVSMCLCTPHLHAKMFAQSLSKPWNIFENMCCMWTLFSCWKSVQIYMQYVLPIRECPKVFNTSAFSITPELHACIVPPLPLHVEHASHIGPDLF